MESGYNSKAGLSFLSMPVEAKWLISLTLDTA
jgi:hypothetical protein